LVSIYLKTGWKKYKFLKKDGIMKNMNSIRDMYVAGDIEIRLSLYMEVPSMRDEFISIDIQESQSAKKQPSAGLKSTFLKALGIVVLPFKKMTF
jgi:hypothetical protein